MLSKARARVGVANELVRFLWAVRLWWLIPMVVVLLASSILLLLANSATVAPFIYAIF